MTPTPDPAALAREALADDARATPGPWDRRGHIIMSDEGIVGYFYFKPMAGRHTGKINAGWCARAREREPALARALLDLVEERDRLRAALDDAVRVWTFNDYQFPTHSWHDREDWYERHAVAREARRAALSAPAAGKEKNP